MLEETQNRETLVQAVCRALHHGMAFDEDVILLGQDVGQCGGVFRATEGLLERFGAERVVDTPLAESGIIGASVGMALYGLKPVAEIQFSGFAWQAFHQIEQHVSRYQNRTRGEYPMNLVIRMPYGGGVRAFEHHSESRESYFIHTPGLKVLCPATPEDAYGLLNSAIQDPDPVIFLEPKKLYRAVKSLPCPQDYEVAIGKAKIMQEGGDLSLITYGAMVPICHEATQAFAGRYEIELIDLRSLSPLDENCLIQSVQKTGRAIIVHEAPRTLGLGAEIAAQITERAFLSLKAPIKRITGYDTIIPYLQMENEYLPDLQRVSQAIVETMEY